MLEQQAEIQRLNDEKEKHKRLEKSFKYKHELEAQLHERTKKEKLEYQMQHDPNDQKVLLDNYKRFEQKEYDRINQGRERTKDVMKENQFRLQSKHYQVESMNQEEKDVFNRQALEDKLHAEKTAEEKRRWKEWQKESLKNDYEEQIKRKEALQQMERMKEREYANQYKHTVEKYEHDHNKILDDRRRKNEEVLQAQQRTIIPDLNDRRKRDAMDNMKKQFEQTERQTLVKELNRLNKKHNAEKETGDVLKLQMDIRKKRYQTARQDEENYKKYVDNTLNMLGERDRRMAEDRKKLRESYAKDLESQIKEHNEKEKVIYNEMDERSLTLNQRGLMAYEAGERNTGLFKLPGIDRDPTDNRENYARYARNKKPTKMGEEMILNHQHGFNDTASYNKSIKPMSHSGIKTLPYSQHKYKDIPKTSEDYSTYRGERRSSRGLISPPNYKTPNILEHKETPVNAGLGRYKSMASIETVKDQLNHTADKPKNRNEIGVLRGSTTNLLSPRNFEEPQYEPTKREEKDRRSYNDGGVSKSISNLAPYTDKKTVGFDMKQDKPAGRSSKPETKLEKRNHSPESLLNIDRQLNSIVQGAMRADNLATSREGMTYGNRLGSNTYRGYNSDFK